MKLSYIPLFAALLSLAACGDQRTPNRLKNSEISKDTLQYQYKTIKQRASDCGSQPDTNCTYAAIKYTFFEKAPALNDTISHRLANLMGDGKTQYTSLQNAASSLISLYENDKKSGNIHAANMHYSLDSHARIIRQDSSLLTLELSGYDYQGGAHGLTITKFINWDAKKQKDLTLDDIFVSGYQPKLNQIAEQIFRKEENLSPTASLARDYFFKDGKFALNTNFVITPLGIHFLYNQYEIKPYAAGQTTIDIPYAQLSKLLRSDTPAAIYSK